MKRNQQLFGTSRRDYNERDMLRFTQSFIVLTYFPFSIKFSERVLRSLRVMIAAAVTARGWETTSPSELCSFLFFFIFFFIKEHQFPRSTNQGERYFIFLPLGLESRVFRRPTPESAKPHMSINKVTPMLTHVPLWHDVLQFHGSSFMAVIMISSLKTSFS